MIGFTRSLSSPPEPTLATTGFLLDCRTPDSSHGKISRLHFESRVSDTAPTRRSARPLPMTPPGEVPLTRRQARSLARPAPSTPTVRSDVDLESVESAHRTAMHTMVKVAEKDAPFASSTGPTLLRAADHRTSEEPSSAFLDEFEAASRTWSFKDQATERDGSSTAPGTTMPNFPSRGSSGRTKAQGCGSRKAHNSLKRITAASFSLGVLSLVGLLTVGMTTPAEALPHGHPPAVVAGHTLDPDSDEIRPDSDEIQAYVAPAQVSNAEVSRGGDYSVATLTTLASTAGISNLSNSVFTNDRTCSIQWPYAIGVPITSGFGMRDGRMHEGTDFVPGAGAEIQAIADGVVRTATDMGGAFGVTIVIDHVVDGQKVSSRYAHMEYDSRQVEVGDTVSVGEYIGRTGNSGRSFGAHLHFELLLGGTTATDPLPWLRSHASC